MTRFSPCRLALPDVIRWSGGPKATSKNTNPPLGAIVHKLQEHVVGGEAVRVACGHAGEKRLGMIWGTLDAHAPTACNRAPALTPGSADRGLCSPIEESWRSLAGHGAGAAKHAQRALAQDQRYVRQAAASNRPARSGCWYRSVDAAHGWLYPGGALHRSHRGMIVVGDAEHNPAGLDAVVKGHQRFEVYPLRLLSGGVEGEHHVDERLEACTSTRPHAMPPPGPAGVPQRALRR